MNSIRSPQTDLSTTENKALFMKRKPQIRKKPKKVENNKRTEIKPQSITLKLLKIGSYYTNADNYNLPVLSKILRPRPKTNSQIFRL